MRLMSFFHTQQQMRDQNKCVTRRLGWAKAKRGDRVMAVVKVRGRKRSEPIERLGEIDFTHIRRERLDRITYMDVRREGFPEMTRAEFIEMFCREMGCKPSSTVTRIAFGFVENVR